MTRSNGQLKVVRMKSHKGTIRQKVAGGVYYYRVTIAKGVRKDFPLKTKDINEAKKRAEELAKVLEAETKEVAFAQITAIKGFSRPNISFPLDSIWDRYITHPDRAMPHTVSEQESYRSTFNELLMFATTLYRKNKRKVVLEDITDLTPEICDCFAKYLKTTPIAVDTHNRKIKRLRKIFSCFKEYFKEDTPFTSKSLLRQAREEQDSVVRRQAFTREQEDRIREVLTDSTFKVVNKSELRVIFYIGMFTGQRLKDCVLLQWQNIDFTHKRIWVKQFKTGKSVTIPIAPELLEVLQESLTWQINQYVCPKTAERYSKVDYRGKATGNNLVNFDIMRVIKWTGLEPSIAVPGRKKKMTVYGFHSLRHSFASHCAEAGVPKAVLLSILGTDSEIADKYYTHIGDDSQRKAIEAISNYRSNEASPQEKINQVIDILKSTTEPSEAVLKMKELLGLNLLS